MPKNSKFSSPVIHPSIGNETAQASKLYFITSFGRPSQADKILLTQLSVEGALTRPAGVFRSLSLPSSGDPDQTPGPD